MEEELGGEEAFLNSYFGNYTEELAKGTLNSTMICTILAKWVLCVKRMVEIFIEQHFLWSFHSTKVFYEQAKEAIG